jgi:hypothetical protein
LLNSSPKSGDWVVSLRPCRTRIRPSTSRSLKILRDIYCTLYSRVDDKRISYIRPQGAPCVYKKKFWTLICIVLDPAKNDLSSEGHVTQKNCFRYFYIKMTIFQGYSCCSFLYRTTLTYCTLLYFVGNK